MRNDSRDVGRGGLLGGGEPLAVAAAPSGFLRAFIVGAWNDLASVIPISAVLLTLALAAVAVTFSVATNLSFAHFPDLTVVFVAILTLDVVCRLVPRSAIVRAISLVLYCLLYLSLTSFVGILAAYATQRLALPLQDQLFAAGDRALAIDWIGFVHWVDDRPALAAALRYAYDTMGMQIILPAAAFAFMDRIEDLRIYLLAFVLALVVTTIGGALLPAESPYAMVDSAAFHTLGFNGQTPLEHLRQLRTEGPLVINSHSLGGILCLPSFHAVVAVLTPLSLRNQKALFYPLALLCAATLVGAVTEGGHYVMDIIVGAVLAIAARACAAKMLRAQCPAC